ncbi:hypothetical protein MMA231_02474 [Asticcacaulis sp. MM231]|uniref:hypothetical protein n=1 Tax=Asticcacaulis sp. MM231 TaxID=3157666 RepID=UPI0032D59A80
MLVPTKKTASQTDSLVTFLNEALALDPEFMQAMASHRPRCNQALADHPNIQVGIARNGGFETSFVGLINGFLALQDEARLAVCYDETGRIIEFMRI